MATTTTGFLNSSATTGHHHPPGLNYSSALAGWCGVSLSVGNGNGLIKLYLCFLFQEHRRRRAEETKRREENNGAHKKFFISPNFSALQPSKERSQKRPKIVAARSSTTSGKITAHNSSLANFNSVAIRMYVIRWLLLHLHQTGSTPSNWH